MNARPLDRWLGTGADDPGCAAAFAELDRYAEAASRGERLERFTRVATHLRNCSACREDTEGLVAALRVIGEPGADR